MQRNNSIASLPEKLNIIAAQLACERHAVKISSISSGHCISIFVTKMLYRKMAGILIISVAKIYASICTNVIISFNIIIAKSIMAGNITFRGAVYRACRHFS